MIINTEKEITNIEIMNIARVYNLHTKIKIIMKDETHLIKKNGYYIINLDKSDGNGTHWTSLICTQKECCYCDSYGTPPPEKILNKLKQLYGKVYFTDFIIQAIKSVACGYFALAFIIVYHMYKHKHTLLEIVTKYIDYYNDDTLKNDRKLALLFRSFP